MNEQTEGAARGSGLSSYQRGMVLVTASSMLVPVIGVITAPILTHSLGVAGRGAAGAAVAPGLLIIGVATLGLPQALTFHLAKRPHLTRHALAWATLLALGFAGLSLIGVAFARDFLAGGDQRLADLMLIATWLALPAIVVGLLRGAAAGRQLWTAMAIERSVSSVFRLCVLGALALLGKLDVTSAVVVMCLAPIVGGLTYVRLVFSPAPNARRADLPPSRGLVPDLLGFGLQVWLGSVAIELMGRLDQLLVTPLAGVEQLGLLIVATNVSDVPYIVSQTIREVTFGASSAEADLERLLATSRIATMLAAASALVLGGTLPLWIGFVFGRGFFAAIAPTWLLLVSSCLAVPGIIAGAGLDSAGRPALRSIALAVALVTNFVGLLLLAPRLGAVGAALAALSGTAISTLVITVAASRILGTAAHNFVVVRRSDLALLHTVTMALARGRRRTAGQEALR